MAIRRGRRGRQYYGPIEATGTPPLELSRSVFDEAIVDPIFRKNTFTGTNTTVITNGNSGSDGYAFGVNGSPTYSTTQAHSGTSSMAIVNPVAERDVEWGTLGSLTSTIYTRFYIYKTANPTTNHAYVQSFITGAGSTAALVRILTDGRLSLADSTGSGFSAESTSALPSNQWIRVEVMMTPGAGTGQMQWKYFTTADSDTPTETSALFTGLTLGANVNTVRLGAMTAYPTAWTAYFDDWALGNSWIGPTAAETTVTHALSRTRAAADTASATDAQAQTTYRATGVGFNTWIITGTGTVEVLADESDATFIRTSTANTEALLLMTAVPGTQPTDITVGVRHERDGTGTGIVVTLEQNGVPFATRTITPSTSITSTDIVLTSGELAAYVPNVAVGVRFNSGGTGTGIVATIYRLDMRVTAGGSVTRSIALSRAPYEGAINWPIGTGSLIFGSTTTQQAASEIVLASDTAFGPMEVYVGKTNSPTDSLVFDVVTSLTGSAVQGLSVTVSNTVMGDGSALLTLAFPQVMLAPGTYYLRATRTGAQSAINRYNWRRAVGSSNAEWSYDGASWTDAGGQFAYRVPYQTVDTTARSSLLSRAAADTAAASDTVSANVVPAGGLNISRTPSDTAGATDTLARSLVLARAPPDTAAATDVVTRARTSTRAAADTAAATDAVARSRTSTRAAADTAAATDTVARVGPTPQSRPAADTAAASDAAARSLSQARAATDTAPATDAVVGTRYISLQPDTVSADGACWTPVNAATQVEAINDHDDADYIKTETFPCTTRYKLASYPTPPTGTRKLRMRVGNTGTGTVTYTLNLYEGGGTTLGAGTLKGTAATTRSTTGLVTVEATVTDSISNYSDLYVEMTAEEVV